MYSMIATAIAMLSTMALTALLLKEGYIEKILVKLGLKKRSITMNWTAFSWENCLRKLNVHGDMVFLGDSLVRGGNFHERFPQARIVNLGSSGDTLAGMIGRIPAVQAVSPGKVFVMGGINSLTDWNLVCCISQYEDLILELGKAIPTAKIYILSILPLSNGKARKICKNSTVCAFNTALQELAERYGHTYIDLHSLYMKGGEMDPDLTVDGLYLKPEAYKFWYGAVEPYV